MADANIVLTSVALSGTIVQVINWLKKSKYAPWVTGKKIVLLRGLSVVGAALSGAGINHVWSSADHSLLISGLTVPAVLAFAKAMWVQAVAQESIYQATKRTSDPAVVVAVAPKAAKEEGLIPDPKAGK